MDPKEIRHSETQGMSRSLLTMLDVVSCHTFKFKKSISKEQIEDIKLSTTKHSDLTILFASTGSLLINLTKFFTWGCHCIGEFENSKKEPSQWLRHSLGHSPMWFQTLGPYHQTITFTIWSNILYCNCLLGLRENHSGQTSTLQNEMKFFLKSRKAKMLMELGILEDGAIRLIL